MLHHLLLSVLLPQGPGLTATVDDPRSHGAVADPLLSLDEAIRVANGTLPASALSPAAQARITGTGTLVETIVVDAAITPAIVLEAPLTEVTGVLGVHQHVAIRGVAAPAAGMPVIQGGAHARVFTLRSYGASVHELRIVGGQVGVDVRMAQPAVPATHMAEIGHCELDGQTVAGVRAHGTGTDESTVMVMETMLANMPVGLRIDDDTAGGKVMVEAEHVRFDAVARGCSVAGNGTGAAMSMLALFRTTFGNGQTFAEVRRSAASTNLLMCRFVHCDARASGTVVDVEGNAAGLTMVHHHHSDFVAAAGQKAFWARPRTATFDLHGSEMTFEGDVAIGANLASPRIWQQNNRYVAGTITLDVDGALPSVLWNRYENCSLVVPASARSPVAVRSSELANTAVTGASFLAPITLQGCWRGGGALSGFVTEQQPAPARFLGTTSVGPAEPQVGTAITFATDLPAGIALAWDVAIAYPRPNTALSPVRFYGDPATVVVLPAVLLYQSLLTVPIPNDAALAGHEFYAQGVAVPLFGQSFVPTYHLPRGQLLRLRL